MAIIHVGSMVLSTLDILRREGLFSSKSVIKLIPLVLALALTFAHDYPGDYSPEIQWT